MKEIPLKEFCETNTQVRAGEILGRSQGAISQMINAGREIFIVQDIKGKYSWYEIKRKKSAA